ncbi:hypothetical protein EPN28_02825 [Patescibacteria group bacterium]|nr:MAG: hypothetical protein EPN28_02825 [Patescibacteria group bacterium]
MLNIFNVKNHNGNRDTPSSPPPYKGGGVAAAGNSSPIRGGTTPHAKNFGVGVKGGVKTNFTKYQDPEKGMSGGQLKWSLWFSGRRVIFYRAALIFVAAAAIIIWLFSLWRWVFFIIEIPDARRVRAELARFDDYSIINQRIGFQPVQIFGAQFLASGKDKYDVAAEMFNPNTRSVVFFDYYFFYNNTSTPKQSAFLLPGQRRPLVALGLAGAAGEPVLHIENVKWKKISAHDVSDPKQYQDYRLNFAVTDFVFSPASESGADFPAVKFNLTNNGPYSYNAPKFLIGLTQNEELVSVFRADFASFAYGETKNMDIRLFVPNASAAGAIVYPLINIYDKEAYLR